MHKYATRFWACNTNRKFRFTHQSILCWELTFTVANGHVAKYQTYLKLLRFLALSSSASFTLPNFWKKPISKLHLCTWKTMIEYYGAIKNLIPYFCPIWSALLTKIKIQHLNRDIVSLFMRYPKMVTIISLRSWWVRSIWDGCYEIRRKLLQSHQCSSVVEQALYEWADSGCNNHSLSMHTSLTMLYTLIVAYCIPAGLSGSGISSLPAILTNLWKSYRTKCDHRYHLQACGQSDVAKSLFFTPDGLIVSLQAAVNSHSVPPAYTEKKL